MKLWIIFLALLCISFVSATNSGHLCDGVSDDGRHVVDVLWNPMVTVFYQVDGVNFSRLEYNGSAVRVSHNGGQSFSVYQLGRPDSAFYFSGVTVSNDGQKILAWDNNDLRHVLYYSVDGGLNWSKYDRAVQLSTACISGNTIVASGDTVLVSSNGGLSFSDKSIYSYRAYTGGFLKEMFQSRFRNFNVVSPMIPIGGSNLVMSDDGSRIVVARYGANQFAGHIWWSDNGGQSFHNVPISYHGNGTDLLMEGRWNGLVMSCDGEHVIISNEGYSFAVGGQFWENGDVLVSDNSGVDWRVSTIPNAGEAVFAGLGMDCVGNVEVWKHDASAGTYVKYTSADYGTSWSSSNAGYNPILGGVTFTPSSYDANILKQATYWTIAILLGVFITILIITIFIIKHKKHKRERR